MPKKRNFPDVVQCLACRSRYTANKRRICKQCLDNKPNWSFNIQAFVGREELCAAINEANREPPWEPLGRLYTRRLSSGLQLER